MRYSANYHPDRVDEAMHVKGIELAAYLGQTNPGYAFAIAGPHTSIDTYNRAWYPEAENTVEEWTENILRGPIMILYDMNGLCKFSKVGLNDVCSLLKDVTGREVGVEELKDTAKKVALMSRMIDYGRGFTEEDDILPGRCHQEIGIKGIPHFNTLEFFNELKDRVYQAYGEMKRQWRI